MKGIDTLFSQNDKNMQITSFHDLHIPNLHNYARFPLKIV